MSNIWEKAIDEIVGLLGLQKNLVVPFVGAGISRAAGLPTWQELADAIVDTVHGFQLATNEEITDIKNASPLSMLTFCRQRLGDDMFRRQILSSLKVPDNFVPPNAAELCWRLNEQIVVTTNLDDVLERASTVQGFPAEPLTPSDALSAALTSEGRRVLHIHGMKNRFETWVMTEPDFITATGTNTTISAVLQALLLDRVLLFLGYSCNDPNLNLFLEHFKDHFPKGHSNHYALMPDLTDEDRRRLICYAISPIEYTPSSSLHPEVAMFLEDVLTKFDPKKAEVLADERTRQPAFVPLSLVSDLRMLSFVSRRDQLNSEFSRLFDQSENYTLTGSAELPHNLKMRRSETLELLAGVWQIDSMPPANAIDGREVKEEIGRGGFGVVWEVEDVKTHERQALKVAHFQETSNYKFIERFKQGIRAMRRLTYHNIKNTTRYLGHREVPLCVFMEHIDGGNLENLIKKVPLDLKSRLLLGLEIAEIVADAHKIPVYHRDLKPSNVLIRWGEDGQPHAVLSDFDLAWFEGAISMTSTRVGDQAFASPEQLKETRVPLAVRAESDIYSLGMLLMFLVSSRIPSGGQWYNQNLHREVFDITDRQFRWLRGAELFADLVAQCASEDPSMRQSATGVASELRRLYDAESFEVADASMFIEEVRLGIAKSYSGSLSPVPGCHIEHRRDSGRSVIQASISRQLRDSDDRGRFHSQATKAVKGLRLLFEDSGWNVQSTTANNIEAKIVAKREMKHAALGLSKEVISTMVAAMANWSKNF